MIPFKRSSAPAELKSVAKAVGLAFAAKREADAATRFAWPSGLYEVTRSALGNDTAFHCSYCDSFPIDATGKEEVDHFKPKSEFPLLVCEWRNLFFCCTACNGVKRENWHHDLLRADAKDFSFERYFLFRSDTGTLEPNPAATSTDQRRARKTIELLGLNRAGLCWSRRRVFKSAEPDAPYRFIR